MSKSLDEYLNEIDYNYLNSTKYVPTQFALIFVNFIKLVNGAQGESNKTPPVHLLMLDKIARRNKNKLANLCHRGLAKGNTLTTPILTTNGWKTMGSLQIGDYVYGEDGKPARVSHKSEVFYKPVYRITLGDGRQLEVSDDHINVIIQRKTIRQGKKKFTAYVRREVTTKELLGMKLTSTRKVTPKSPKGKENLIWIPNPEPVDLPTKDLPLDPYLLGLLIGDGSLKDSIRLFGAKEDLDFYIKFLGNKVNWGTRRADTRNPNVHSISIKGISKIIKNLGLNVHGDFKFIPKEYLYGSIQQRIDLLKGLMDTDGSASGVSYFSSNSLQLIKDVQTLVYSLGGSTSIHSRVTSSNKVAYKLSIFLKEPAFNLPRKLDKWKPSNSNQYKVAIKSIEPIPLVPSQCIYVENKTHTYLAGDYIVTHNTTLFGEYLILYLATFGELPGLGDVSVVMYVADTMDNGAKSLRKNLEFRYNNSEFLKKVIPEASFTDAFIEFTNDKGHKLAVKLYGATSGIRGAKVYGKRPTLAILDDLVSDEAAKSKATMDLIKETVSSGINYALDPTKNLVIFNGTPFNKEDVLVQAVESGAWEVNVFPVCEKFPCSQEEFRGSWEDRFSYEYIKTQYENARKEGRLNSFYQELMLRLSTDEEKLIQEADINWYNRADLIKFKYYYNIYITTDFATSSKESADYSVISVWALNANGDWFYLDGICRRQTMDSNIDDLFFLVQKYQPISVGIEITGQQKAFIAWIQKEMIQRNIWFNFAKEKGSKESGIRPTKDKLSRFNLVVPWFKARKVYFPRELIQSPVLKEILLELSLVTYNGIKGKDDCLDTISMLAFINAIRPSERNNKEVESVWEEPIDTNGDCGLKSYIV